jgi:hypothetical protein
MKSARLVAMAAAAAVCLGSSALRADGPSRVSTALEPSQEVPAVSSPDARGRFVADIDDDAQAIDFELSFSGLQAPVVMSHIHMAQPGANGGIVVWLCGTASNPGPPGTQTCPQQGTVRGTIRPENVVQVTTQGIAPGDFGEVVSAMRNGLAYVNVHTQQSPLGEIRGQLGRGAGHK